GARPLTAPAPAATAGAQLFGLHPLQTVAEAGASLHGCACAVAGSTEPALAEAERIARNLGMRPFTLRDDQRPAYHAAASIASNYLVTLQAAAATLAERAGIDELDAGALFGPLVRTTVENWISLGPADALTMGFFHDGHLSLMRGARAECGVVVVSLFVNPAQFAPGEDLEAYPRDEARDASLAASEGVDLLFAPATEEVYPPGFSATVAV